MMESSNRTLWIILAVAVIVLCGCCFALVLLLAPVLLGISWTQDSVMLPALPSTRATETTEHVFSAVDQPFLTIDSFAGGVEIRPESDDEIQVVVTKSARKQRDLERINVEFREEQGGLIIETSVPASLRNAWVKLEIITPTSTTLDMEVGSGSLEVRGLDGAISVHTGSGSIELRGVTGSVDASTGSGGITVVGPRGEVKVHTGSGKIDIGEVKGMIDASTGSGSLSVHDAAGQVQLETRSGSIEYRGMPADDCSFETGSGSITLDLPADLDMAVDLSTNTGNVDISCDLVGSATRSSAEGVIGDGFKGKIYAHTGSGSVEMNCR